MPLTVEEIFKLSREFTAKRLAEGHAPDVIGELEGKGWEHWLMTIFPFWFEEEFSDDHRKFWNHFWRVIFQVKKGERVALEVFVILVILGRGLGKSAMVEAARIMRGAILGKGYGLIVSETDDQAQEHLGNARILIEHPDSRLTEFYPEMAIAENTDVLKGLKTTDRKEMFVCKNGYILRAKGLAAKMRGLRVGTLRPDDICFDDIDDVDDSLIVSVNKLRLITASILPVQARFNVTISFAQNLISEHSVINQIFTGKSDALSARTVVGVTNAFAVLDIDSMVDETGKMRHTILESSVPTWPGLDVDRAQKFLSDSGLATFMAEYQNQFDAFNSGKVIKEYNEPRQVITWSQFEKVYGSRQVPSHWQTKVGLDVGYSEGSMPHFSAWVFVATAAMNSDLPGKVFVYRARSFKGTSIDDQADDIKQLLYRNKQGEVIEKPKSWQMSHEKTGEMMTLNQKHKLPFGKFRAFKAEDGVPQWRHLSRPDLTTANPFKKDVQKEDGTWTIGDTELFYIVDDKQEFVGEDDDGMALLREQVSQWEYVPVKITETGQTVQKPSKLRDDFCDALKGVFVSFSPLSTALNAGERMQIKIRKLYPEGTIERIEDPILRAHMYTARGIKSAQVREQIQERAKVPEPDWAIMG